jgi:cytoskeletal protein CcmA (bactofilin family)
MLSTFKGRGPEKDFSASGLGVGRVTAPPAPQLLVREPMPQPAPARTERLQPEISERPERQEVSIIGPNMSIAGQVVCTGEARIFGRVEGEVRVSNLLLGDGAQVEGSVVAQDVTVRGHVKGTLRALRVRLEDGAIVEGDIFHRSLSIQEGALFEGSSRRVENPTEALPRSPRRSLRPFRPRSRQPRRPQPQRAQPHPRSRERRRNPSFCPRWESEPACCEPEA